MSLKETLMQDLKTAMKTKDKRTKDTITMVRAAIKQKEVDERVELDDDGVLTVLAKEIKERRGSIEEFEKAGRDDLIGWDERCLIRPPKRGRQGISVKRKGRNASFASGGEKRKYGQHTRRNPD